MGWKKWRILTARAKTPGAKAIQPPACPVHSIQGDVDRAVGACSSGVVRDLPGESGDHFLVEPVFGYEIYDDQALNWNT